MDWKQLLLISFNQTTHDHIVTILFFFFIHFHITCITWNSGLTQNLNWLIRPYSFFFKLISSFKSQLWWIEGVTCFPGNVNDPLRHSPLYHYLRPLFVFSHWLASNCVNDSYKVQVVVVVASHSVYRAVCLISVSVQNELYDQKH